MVQLHRSGAKAPVRMARISATVALLFATNIAVAGTFTAFGPIEFIRNTEAPVASHYSIPVRNAAVPYRLRVENGGDHTRFTRVASAMITLNGNTVFRENDFNAAKSDVLEAAVTVVSTNDLSVELRGEPGSGLVVRLLGEDTDPPLIRALAVPAPNAAGWASSPVTVSFYCSDATTPISQCSEPVTLSSDGANQSVTGSATDGAGNTASVSTRVSIDRTSPVLSSGTVPAATSTSPLTVSGTLADALSGVASATCNHAPALLNAGTFTCAVTLLAGSNTIQLTGTDAAGNTASRSLQVLFDQARPLLQITQPTDGQVTPSATFDVIGRAVDDDQVARVTVGGVSVPLTGSSFTGRVALVEGLNTIDVVATDRAGNQTSSPVRLTRFTVPAVAITAPADQATVQTATVSVSGTVSDALAAVRVNGVVASVSGSTWRADNVPLAQGRTVVTASATNAAGHTASSTVYVYRDSIPPRVSVYSPADGATIYQPSIDVTGMVDDIVVGTINAGQVRITVNGRQAEVANRAFLAPGVTLTPGLNTITIIATDQGGNSTTVSTHVTYDAASRAKILVVSGDGQRGAIGSTLPQPLVVRLVDAAGTPVRDRAVTFQVTENNGSLTSAQATARVVIATTNAQGEAAALWHLGTRSGAGNNRVSAAATGFAGAAEFEAAATSAAPARIVLDSGSNQFGACGAALPRPLAVAVVDSGSNRIAGVPVTFSVLEGDATFGTQSSVDVTTDGDGRAWITPVLGNARANSFTASINNGASAVTFTATAKPAGPPEQTRISGVVLDNQNSPIGGVSIRVEGTTLTTQSNDQGQFLITNAPVGYVKLIADGSTAGRSGTWPTLEYAVYTIAGQNNTLEMPVYLLPIDVRRGIFVDETTGGTLTIPEMPGFALTVAPGSAMFPGGSRTGTISATLVHSDKVPMSPGFGQQPRFIVTIQPPGVHFETPAALTIPNADGLAPGQVTEMYSFDHDLGQFVSIGTGSVSEDGSVIRSDPGVGIIKGGWHCGGDPATKGATAKCPECAKCDGKTCFADPAKVNQPCKDDGDNCTEDICEGGTCQHKPFTVSIGGPAPYQNEYVDKDDPTRTWANRQTLSEGTSLYGNSTIGGDMVTYRAYISSEFFRGKVSSYTWSAAGPAGQSGPSTPEWSISPIDWQPGTYTVKCVIKFSTGCEKTATYTQEVGIRTDDNLAIGWINPAGVPLNPGAAHFDVVGFFPPGGFFITDVTQRLLTAAYLGTIALGNLQRPVFVWDTLSADDRTYILNWMFFWGGNFTAPPDGFSNESDLQGFFGSRTRYKLFNRMQMKYLVAGGKITSYAFVHQQTAIGWTTDPITNLLPVPGNAGPNNNICAERNDDTVHCVNDGTPDSPAVAAFNTLAQPLKWNDIGSRISEGVPYNTSFALATQVYPTYFVYENLNRNGGKTRTQAAQPIGNFNLNPYPPGPCPFCIP